MNVTPRHRYWVVPPRSATAIAWNPFDADDLPLPDCAYVGAVLRAMEGCSEEAGLTVYVTWDLERLPRRGTDVVAIVLGDEWARVPGYSADVRAVFKTYGTRYPFGAGAQHRLSARTLLSLAQDLRVSAIRLPNAVTARRRALRRARIYDIPLGYYRQLELPMVPLEARRFDVYFAGSMTNNRHAVTSWRSWLRSPKNASRSAMLARVGRLARERPDLAISTAPTASFLQTTSDEARAYSWSMMQTRICLVPRGTSLETYRFFEGLRAGCVLVGEALPRRRYYDGAPMVRLSDWNALPGVVCELLSDRQRLNAAHRASLAWWGERCAPPVVGRFLAERLHAH